MVFMLKIMFQIFFVIFLMFGDFVIADKPYNFTMLKQCSKDLVSSMQGVAFFSSTEFWQFQIQPSSSQGLYTFFGKKIKDIKPFEHLFSTCHCSDTKKAYFFFPTSLKVDGRLSNGIAVCVRQHKKKCLPHPLRGTCSGYVQYYKRIPGIKDSKDLYDLMAYKYSTILPRNVMSSSVLSDNLSMGCVDIYGKPTHSFDGIQSCLVQYLYNRVNGSDYVYKYSGPLLYGNLDWIPDDFLDTINTAVQYEVDKTYLGYCKFHENGTLYSFTCVCHGETQENCRIQLNNKVCAYDTQNVSVVWEEEAFKEKCGYFFISNSTSDIDVKIGGISFSLSHTDLYLQVCGQYSAEEWCSKVGTRTSFYETYKECCDDEDFCNIIKVNYLKNQIDNYTTNGLNCTYSAKGQAVFYGYCELYYDLMSKNMVVLNPFVSKELHNSTAATESCYYVILTITLMDNENCTTRLYTESDDLHFFYKCQCRTSNCDGDEEEMALEMNDTVNNVFRGEFYCESVNYGSNSDYRAFELDVLKSVGKETGAICFIEISVNDDIYNIKAEAIKDNLTLDDKPTCNDFSFSPNSSNETSTGKKVSASCCTVILQQPQSKSNCTIEIMLNIFQNQIKNENIQKQFTGEKGTLKCGKNDCLISDGCYETREITVDHKKKEAVVGEDDVEEEITSSSLECVSKIEEKVISEAPLSSIWNPDYGYVCKLMEAKDRCTVVHPQDSNSKPIIVCCCIEGYKILSASDGTFKCPTKLKKLPSEFGKRIGSFH